MILITVRQAGIRDGGRDFEIGKASKYSGGRKGYIFNLIQYVSMWEGGREGFNESYFMMLCVIK